MPTRRNTLSQPSQSQEPTVGELFKQELFGPDPEGTDRFTFLPIARTSEGFRPGVPRALQETLGGASRVAQGLRGEGQPSTEDIVNTVGGLTGGGMTAGRSGLGGTVGTFGGTSAARNLPRSPHQLARMMESRGASPLAIHKQTNFSRGADGLWRFEIDDTKAKAFYPIQKAVTGRLDQFLDHPDLYKHYPELAKLPVRQMQSENFTGVYMPPTKERPEFILVNRGLPADQLKETLLHEVQHSIQFREGFARGGGSMSISLEDSLQSVARIHPDSEKVRQHIRRFNAMTPEQKQEMAARTYRRLAGEVEARNVELRSQVSSENLRFIHPAESEQMAGFTSRKQQIVIPEIDERSFGAAMLQEMGFRSR